MNIYKFRQGWGRKLGGEEETLLKKFTRRSLTKVHLSTIVLDLRMKKLLEVLELELRLV